MVAIILFVLVFAAVSVTARPATRERYYLPVVLGFEGGDDNGGLPTIPAATPVPTVVPTPTVDTSYDYPYGPEGFYPTCGYVYWAFRPNNGIAALYDVLPVVRESDPSWNGTQLGSIFELGEKNNFYFDYWNDQGELMPIINDDEITAIWLISKSDWQVSPDMESIEIMPFPGFNWYIANTPGMSIFFKNTYEEPESIVILMVCD
jgi:hypothetical protein